MANKRYTSTIDSFGVDEHMLRVSGRVNVLHSDASEMPYDGEVLVVLLGRMTAPSYSETKDGDVIRVNVMKPIEVKVVKDLKDRRKIMEKLYFEHEAQLVFTDMAGNSETGPSESPITLLDLSREAQAVLEEDPDIDSADVEITGGFDPSVEEVDTNVLGEPEEDGQWVDGIFVPSWVDAQEDEWPDGEWVEGDDGPEWVTSEITDVEDEAEFLRQFMLSHQEPRRVKVGGQAERDPILRSFLES